MSIPDPISIINKVLELDKKGMLNGTVKPSSMKPPGMVGGSATTVQVQAAMSPGLRMKGVHERRLQEERANVAQNAASSAEEALRRMKLQYPVDNIQEDKGRLALSPTSRSREEIRRLTARLSESVVEVPMVSSRAVHDLDDTSMRILDAQEELVAALKAPPPQHARLATTTPPPLREIHTPHTNPYPVPYEHLHRNVATPPTVLTPRGGNTTASANANTPSHYLVVQLFELSGFSPTTHEHLMAPFLCDPALIAALDRYREGEHLIQFKRDGVKERWLSVLAYPTEARKVSPCLVVTEDVNKRFIRDRVPLCEVVSIEAGLEPEAFKANLLRSGKLKGPDGSEVELGPAGAFSVNTSSRTVHLCATSAEQHRMAVALFQSVVDMNSAIRAAL